MTEPMSQEELREKIKELIQTPPHYVRATSDGGRYVDVAYEQLLDSIMSLIKANCWPKGEQEAPKPNSMVEHIGFGLGVKKTLEAGFKPCGKWE